MKNLLRGLSKILDIFATSRSSIYSLYNEKTDLELLREDWGMVAEDISFAFNLYEKESKIRDEQEEYDRK